MIHIRRSCAISAALTITLALCTPVFAKTSAVKYDVIISGGTVFDGSGRAGVASDVAITNGQIVRIGKIDPKSAKNLKLKERGMLKPGFFADVVVFDPATIADKATYAEPMQYAVGVSDVFVNGVQVLKNGEHTGSKPGQVVRGPGWTGWKTGIKTP